MKYRSTRGESSVCGFEEAVLNGLADDKGLYVPDVTPQITLEEIREMGTLNYPELVVKILSLFISEDEVPREILKNIAYKSYSTFQVKDAVVCKQLKNFWILELFHGPTFAFKDFALQFLGNLFEFFLERGRYRNRTTILGATSGDTGSAAIHGLKGKKNINCYILYPEKRITEIQERQMTTVQDSNIYCLSIEGDFDQAQGIVKAAFTDASFRDSVQLAAVNSINWARILVQIPYYFYAWFRVLDSFSYEDFNTMYLNFAVPTGNFGDILAGYYAKRMGLPIRKLILATNHNDVLHKFFETGCYCRANRARETLAPAMDISISSNFERFLFYLADENSVILSSWMSEFESTGKMSVNEVCLARAREYFATFPARDEDITAVINQLFLAEGYLVCPHTACAVNAVSKLQMIGRNTVILATAHPSKFLEALKLSLPEHLIPRPPEEMQMLFHLPQRKTLIPPQLEEIENFIRATIN